MRTTFFFKAFFFYAWVHLLMLWMESITRFCLRITIRLQTLNNAWVEKCKNEQA